MKKFFFIAILIIAYSLNTVHMSALHTNLNDSLVLNDDDFFSALSQLSEENIDPNTHSADQIFAHIQPVKTEAVEKTSFIQRYAIIAVVKMLTLYGCCKQYAKKYAAYIFSYLYSEQSNAREQ